MDKEYLNNNLPEEEMNNAEPLPQEETEETTTTGKISGFDSVTESTVAEDIAPEKEEPTIEETGYTVTPTGGFYTSPQNNEQPQNSAPDTPKAPTASGFGSFFPSGNYGYNGNTGDNAPQSTVYTPYYSAPKPPKPPRPQKPPKAPKEPKNRSYGVGALIAVALVASILSSSIVGAVISANAGKPNAPTTSALSENNTTEKVVEITGDIEELAATASDKAAASVVGVQTTFAVQSFFSGQSTATGSGSGVIYKSDGYIITNYHVIAEALEYSKSKISVFLNNDTEKSYDASVINYNISCDLAVLKIDKTGLPAIDFADSDNLKVGQYVVAIGSPAGLEFMGSTTFGIISGLNRKISTTDGNMNLIQTDAAINPGNSGGALVNTKGELIGINSSKLVDESYEGMGFAIPSNKVKEICDGLIAHEGEGDPYTGISISSTYTSRVLEYYGYPVGAVVAAVDEGSPAAVAGIRRGDIITKFGDTEITEYTLYETSLKNYFPEDKVQVTFYREGQTNTVTLTIGSAN